MSESQHLLNKVGDSGDGVFDYVAKYDYKAYNEALANIPDDPSTLDQIHKDLKAAFKTGATRSIDFRINQLKSLRQGLHDMKVEICEAIQKDLGRDGFYT